MRRGLIAWSKEEVPAAALEARVRKVQAALRAEGLDAVFAYTSFPRPAAVSWLTHFVPYWSEALLAVLPEGAPSLLASLTKRVHPWIREVSHLGEIVPAPDLGRAAAMLANEKKLNRIGVVDLAELPWPVAEPLGDRLVDFTESFARLRQPADRYESALAERAAQIAEHALATVPQKAKRASDILAAAEQAARLEGAEDVIPRIIDPESVELSVAYKGVWTRLGRSRNASAQADAWFEAALQGSLQRPPGELRRRTVESCVGSAPLSVVENAEQTYRRLPVGARAVLSVELELDSGAWFGAAPFVVRA
jgi:creatinase/prolidase-like protein